MQYTDSGEEIIVSYDADGHILDSGHEANTPSTTREYYFEDTYGMTVADAIIAHYEDLHILVFGYIPLAIAIAVIVAGCIWFEKTFTRY